MEHSKEFYQSVIRVIEYISEGNRSILCEKGEELAGNYWPAVVVLFKEHHAVSVMEGGDIHVTQWQYLNPIYEDCKNHVRFIEKAEADRELANREKIENITYGRKGYRLSRIAILLSAIAILVEIARAIIDLLR